MSRLALLLVVGAALVGQQPGWTQPVPDTALVITELMYAPASSSEFVELYNRSQQAVDLGRLEYADATRDFVAVAPPGTRLAPREHVVLVRDSAAFAGSFSTGEALFPSDAPALNNSGDVVLLRDGPTRTLLDSVPYDPSWGGDDGRSLERLDPDGPSTLAFNFAAATAPAGATPGRRNSRYNPDDTPPRPVFAEQVAPTAVRVTLSEPVPPATITPGAFRLETASVTQAHLSNDSVATLSLSAPPTTSTLRVSGLRDYTGNELASGQRPLAHRPEEGDLIINEILFAPDTDDFDDRPNQVEYVELRNRSSRPLTLHELFLTDRPDETGVADTTRTDRTVVLPPHGHGVVAAAPDHPRSPPASALIEAFPDAPLLTDSVAYVPVDAARLGLQNDGDRVRLHNAAGMPVAEVRYTPDWHTPSLDDPRGTALERISASGDAQSAATWTSSPAAAGGTPGARNAVSLPSSPDAPDQQLTVAPSPFSIDRDGATRIQYHLSEVPALIRVRIYDARGRPVRTLEEARLTGPTGEVLWDGRNDAGNRVRMGVYVVLLEAVRSGGGTVTQLKAPVVVARPLD